MLCLLKKKVKVIEKKKDISSVNFVALYKMFLDKENNVVNSITKGANVVTVVYDSGIKYMSKLFNEENIKGNDIKNIEDIKL